MILQNADVARILKENPTKQIWEKACHDSKVLQMHLLGIGLQDHIKKIDFLEGDRNFLLRKKYGKTNRDLFARVLRPIDNIWNGRGGSVFYNTSKTNDEKLRAMLDNVDNGYSVRDWNRHFWEPRYLDDPMGLIFMEVSSTSANGTYPTYKASSSVFDALPKGRAWIM